MPKSGHTKNNDFYVRTRKFRFKLAVFFIDFYKFAELQQRLDYFENDVPR